MSNPRLKQHGQRALKCRCRQFNLTRTGSPKIVEERRGAKVYKFHSHALCNRDYEKIKLALGGHAPQREEPAPVPPSPSFSVTPVDAPPSSQEP